MKPSQRISYKNPTYVRDSCLVSFYFELRVLDVSY